MSVPESIAWLEVSRNSKSPSTAQIYATTILGELERLSNALDTCARELDRRERAHQEERELHRARFQEFDLLEQRSIVARDEWDVARTALETELASLRERVTYAEEILRDIHHGLLKQPELSREDIANAIVNAGFTPHPEGAK